MAFDGITVAALTKELSDRLTGGHINKISQTDKDELYLSVKCAPEAGGGQEKLYLSADASLPLAYLSESTRQAPLTAPGFCMLLRKYIGTGRISNISQPGLERVIRINIDHRNEMGDPENHTLLIELMGKHSNIIFLDDKDIIMDSIKRISANLSSVREVLPGKAYFIPQTLNKLDPLSASSEDLERVLSAGGQLYRLIYNSFTGISPVIAHEICYRAGLDGDSQISSLSGADRMRLTDVFMSLVEDIKNRDFTPSLYLYNGEVREYACVRLTMYENDASCSVRSYDSVSKLLSDFYSEKNTQTRIHQKSSDLRLIVKTALERNVRKLSEQEKQLHDTEKRDKYRLWGELLTAYCYQIEDGLESVELLDYNTGENVTVPLDPSLSASKNAKRYYDRYTKYKRTAQALDVQMKETEESIEHLASVQNSLDIARDEADLMQIRNELIESGIIHGKGLSGGKTGSGKNKGTNRKAPVSKPFHYISSDGFDIYVGRNNTQNDELTFKVAGANDWWFHAKKIPGSHVVLITGGREVPDRAFEEAAKLAAFYSKAKEQGKAEIDYLLQKDVKKPAGSKPGFVVYYTNYSMVIDCDISGLKEIP